MTTLRHSALLLLVFGCALAFAVSISITPAKENGIIKAAMDPYDISETYQNLMYSYSAYCHPVDLLAWNCYFCTYNLSLTNGFEVYSFVNDVQKNVFGYIGYRQDTLVVAFRGTQADSLMNWISNLDASHLNPYPNVTNAFVHAGFYDAYLSVQAEVRLATQTLISKVNPKRIAVTGHSLGAALAILCAADLATLVNLPVTVYNFGSPRVGNINFITYVQSIVHTTYRIVNEADMVPHLPQKDLGFTHLTREVWYSNATYYTLCSDTNGEDPTCSDSVLLPLNIMDHLRYLNIRFHDGGCK